MAFKFDKKPEQVRDIGTDQARPCVTRDLRVSKVTHGTGDTLASRRMRWAQAVKLSRDRRRLLEELRSGKIARDSINAAELEILDAIQRVEHGNKLEAWVSRFAGTGISAWIASIISSATAFSGSCANQVLKYPLLLKMGAVAGVLGIVALVVAVGLWIIQESLFK
ncbi:MAG: hypothetical protein M9884_10480 [Rhodocyclaceae bacterium]|jgi:uncharacterized membrane protein YdbT with pleckstrin-like domain|nr:hypothetical protein [Rhodocyclaceae bacterium]